MKYYIPECMLIYASTILTRFLLKQLNIIKREGIISDEVMLDDIDPVAVQVLISLTLVVLLAGYLKYDVWTISMGFNLIFISLSERPTIMMRIFCISIVIASTLTNIINDMLYDDMSYAISFGISSPFLSAFFIIVACKFMKWDGVIWKKK